MPRAKRIRRETSVGSYPVSVAAAVADLARGVHGDLDRLRRAVHLGSGELERNRCTRTLMSAGLAHLVASHPTASRADAMARALDCHVASFAALPETLPDF